MTSYTKNTCLNVDCKNYDEYEAEQAYKEMLDDCYGEVEICGYRYSASHALESVDPIAFSCGLSDWESNNECTCYEDEDCDEDEDKGESTDK